MQYFGDNLTARYFCCESNEPYWTMRCKVCLILSECYLLDLLLFERGLGIFVFRLTRPCLIVKDLSPQAKFLEPTSYCTVINCLFTFLYNKCFWLLWRCYSQVWTCKSFVLKLDCVVCSFVWFSNQNMSTYQVSSYFHAQWVPPTSWTASVTRYIYTPN